MRFFHIISGLLMFSLLSAQNTVGLISYVPSQSFAGYNLIYPHNQSTVFLLNNCGEIVHQWQDEANWRPGNTAYLTEEGLLYKAKRDAIVTGDDIWAGGGGAVLEIRDWENNLIWDFEMNDAQYRLHHDFAITADGTIIALAWEYKSTEECIAAGRDTSTLTQKVMWPDWVFEIDPDTDQIIWEWHAWDHVVQDFDSTRANFGIISEHEELIDLNFGREDGHPDWMHTNALDYNEELDQIMLSVPYFDEVWIIDHTTTTEEAAGSSGGFSSKGGDLMFRWGNPETYDNGDLSEKKYFFQHDAHWIDDFLEPAHPDYGKIAVFNNQYASDFSVASIIKPVWNMYQWKYDLKEGRFLPENYEENIAHPDLTSMWSTGLSSVQVLPNGNRLLTAGRFGYSFELTPDNNIVWEYITPLIGQAAATQGDSLIINDNLTFRMKRYPSDFSAFDDRNLSPKGWMEISPDSTFCEKITNSIAVMDESNYNAFPNPVSEMLTVEWDGMMRADLEIFDLMGESVFSERKISGGRKYLDLSFLNSGIYLLSIDRRYTKKIVIN